MVYSFFSTTKEIYKIFLWSVTISNQSNLNNISKNQFSRLNKCPKCLLSLNLYSLFGSVSKEYISLSIAPKYNKVVR